MLLSVRSKDYCANDPASGFSVPAAGPAHRKFPQAKGSTRLRR
jgi:hypothetical protein